jgi:hypothetical protein
MLPIPYGMGPYGMGFAPLSPSYELNKARPINAAAIKIGVPRLPAEVA